MLKQGLLFIAASAIFIIPSLASTEALDPDPTVLNVLTHARKALGALSLTRPNEIFEAGSIVAGGMQGTIQCSFLAENAGCTTTLGPQHDWLVHLGANFYRHDVSGLTRRLNGVLLAHHRTMTAIETNQFLDHPEWISLIGSRPFDPQHLLWFRIQVPGGDVDRIGFDRKTYLPVQAIAPAEDGPQIVSYSDWRWVNGYRFPFHVHRKSGNWPQYDIQFATIQTGPQSVTSPITMPASQRVRAAGVVHIPTTSRDDHQYVPVSIHGKNFEFILDSGSQTIVIDRRVATAINIPTQGTFAINATRRMNNVAFGELPGLDIGAAHFGPQLAVVTDLGTTADGTHRVDGILGFPIFAQAAIQLQPEHALLNISEPGTLMKQGSSLPFSLDHGFIEVEGHVAHGSKHARFVIDTGSAENLLLYHAYAQRFPNAYHLGTRRERTYGIGGSVVSIEAELAGLTLQGLPPMTNVPMHVLYAKEGAFDNHLIAGSLGMGFLRKYHMNCDLQNGVFSLEDQSTQ